MLNKFINKWTETNLILKILIGIISGAVLGILIAEVYAISLLGILFLTALKSIAPFLVFIMVISALSHLNKGITKNLRTCIILYVCSMLLACFVAVTICFIFSVTLTFTPATQSASASISAVLIKLFTDMVTNPLCALVEGNYIGILFWAIVLGIIAKSTLTDTTKKILDDFSNLMVKCVNIIIQFTPIGVLELVFTTVSQNGLSIFTIYGQLILVIVLSMILVALITDPLIVGLVLKRNPFPLVLTCIRESAITAFF